ncbi:UNVERIFIED_CONTAM: hypothetical protein RMT77_012845 [Armadillidium vulgare]
MRIFLIIKMSLKQALLLRNGLINILRVNHINIEQVRHASVDLRKPRTHWRRILAMRVAKPKYKKRYEILPIDELCTNALIHKSKLENEGIHHPYLKILAKEHYETIDNAKVVAIFHAGPYQQDDFHEFLLDLHDINLARMEHRKRTIDIALEGSKYEPLLRLFETSCFVFTSDEVINFSKLLKVSKKYTFSNLISGIYEGRVLSVTDFKTLADNPNIKSYQSQLSGLLATPGQMLATNLQYHQQQLCSALTRYIEDKKKETSS